MVDLNQSIVKPSQKTRKYEAEDSIWSIDSVIEQNINVSKKKSLGSSPYIKLWKELMTP